MAQPTIAQCLFKAAAEGATPVVVHIKKEQSGEAEPDSSYKAEADAGAGAGAFSSDKPFSSDKACYNKFNYKLKLAPESMKNTWKVLRSQE
eukprot:2091193-Heterocapsa_arctica.AAC.1